jgi:signal transduction histidine kinase
VAVLAATAWVVGAITAVWLVPNVQVTSWAAASPALLCLTAVAGLALVAAGALGTLVGRRGSFGPLALLAGAAWLAPGWVGWEDGPAWLRAAGLVVAPLLVPALVHLSALGGRGRLATRWDGGLVLAAWAATSALVVARALVHEPIRDRDCWVACRNGGNPWLVWSDPSLARGLGTALLVTTVALTVAAVARAAVRVLPHRTAWTLGVAVTLPAAAALAGEAAYAVVLLGDRTERFDGAAGTLTYVVRAAALAALAAGISWATWWRLRVARRRVGVLAAGQEEGSGPGELETRLARSLRDDSLEIRYRLAGSDRTVDAAGLAAPLAADDGRAAVTVTRAGEPVATVLHDPRRVSSTELEAGLGALARMAIDNDRLRATASAHLAELQESRARIVAAGDDLRRAVERDLHDGAQQRLLAAAYELRLASTDSADADPEVRAELDRLVVAAADALEQLREFAHGVFPAVLDEAGLEAALFSLADGAAVPVELEVSGLAGLPAPAARAAYVVVRTVVEAASTGDVVEVRVEREGDDVVVETTGGGAVDPVRLADRVGAVGGEVAVAPGSVRAVVPCA